LLVLKRLLLI